MWANDIISQTFRTSVRFLKRNNDDNKTLNGTQFLTDGSHFTKPHQGAHKAMRRIKGLKSSFQRHLVIRNLHYLRFTHKLRPYFPFLFAARGGSTSSLHSKANFSLTKIFRVLKHGHFQFHCREELRRRRSSQRFGCWTGSNVL